MKGEGGGEASGGGQETPVVFAAPCGDEGAPAPLAHSDGAQAGAVLNQQDKFQGLKGMGSPSAFWGGGLPGGHGALKTHSSSLQLRGPGGGRGAKSQLRVPPVSRLFLLGHPLSPLKKLQGLGGGTIRSPLLKDSRVLPVHSGRFHEVSESTHWTPFLNASVHYIRENYPRPWEKVGRPPAPVPEIRVLLRHLPGPHL